MLVKKFKSKSEALDVLAIDLLAQGVDLEIVDPYITAAESDTNDESDSLEPTFIPKTRYVW